MKAMHPKSALVAVAVCAACLLATFPIVARADEQQVTIETVLVGNPGNKGELSGKSVGGYGPDATLGGVAYEFRIGKYEVTNAQYVAFLNAVDQSAANLYRLYKVNMTADVNGGVQIDHAAPQGSKYKVKAGYERKPVVFVSRYDAFRFSNWLHNGQGNGDIENGSYTLPGRKTEIDGGARLIQRNPGARWFLPSESEWYKAAYHKNDGATGNYWDYPTCTNERPRSVQPPTRVKSKSTNSANFTKNDSWKAYLKGVCMLTDVGAFSRSVGPYGTFDQGGNAAEWTEAVLQGADSWKIVGSGGKMVLFQPAARGGNWTHFALCMSASYRGCSGPPWHAAHVGDRGFRVACIAESRTGEAASD